MKINKAKSGLIFSLILFVPPCCLYSLSCIVHVGRFVLYPTLDTRISFVHSFVLLLRHARTTPPGFWNGLDWRALVESCPPNIGKLRGKHFVFLAFFFPYFFLFFEKVIFLDFLIFWVFWPFFNFFLICWFLIDFGFLLDFFVDFFGFFGFF